MRYFIEFSYNGTAYHGWQIQPNAITVQEVLQSKLSLLLRQRTEIVGAGRTDAGVHALQMFGHFDSPKEIPLDLTFRMNAFLPKDIVVHEILPVMDDAHARFDAVERTYFYYIETQKNAFNYGQTWQLINKKLDLEKMNECAAELLNYSDFTSFARLHSDNKTNICKLHQAYWTLEKDQLKLVISADRFLRNMVRAVVGTLVDVGVGKINLTQFKEIIEKKDRKFASASAPPQGLFLAKVQYDKSIFL